MCIEFIVNLEREESIIKMSCREINQLSHKYSEWVAILDITTLLAFTAKYAVPNNQWTWLCQALLEVSMTTIALWICVCADDWAAELAVKASNESSKTFLNWMIFLFLAKHK